MSAVPIRVLLIEDDDAYAALIGAELAAAAPEICFTRVSMLVSAASVSSQPFDAVLLDLDLEKRDSSVERVREAVGDVPIIVLTSRDDETLALGSVQRGAQDYIVKQHVTGPLLARAIHYAIERAVFQRSLLESEARRSAIVDASLDGIVTIDARGIITDFNPAAERMFKRTRAEAIGFELGGLIVLPDYRDAHRAGLASYPHGSPSAIIGRCVQTEGMCSDGTMIPIELMVVELPSSGGHRMFTASLRDLSGQRTTEEALRTSGNQLRQALKMEAIGRLAGGIAHDFNNVLTAIYGYTDLLLEQCEPEDPKLPHLQEIRKSAERAATLTRQLLAFSRRQRSKTCMRGPD